MVHTLLPNRLNGTRESVGESSPAQLWLRIPPHHHHGWPRWPWELWMPKRTDVYWVCYTFCSDLYVFERLDFELLHGGLEQSTNVSLPKRVEGLWMALLYRVTGRKRGYTCIQSNVGWLTPLKKRTTFWLFVTLFKRMLLACCPYMMLVDI